MALVTVASADPLAVTVRAEPPVRAESFHMGTLRRPDGSTLAADETGLRLDGHPLIPVMGEFHYTRYPAKEWREELLKMKAGGITIVSTYVFWIHHEEVEGEWNWSDNHDLHEFVRLAGSVGLKVVVRCGPWCHGEVRNGGFPDWLVAKGWKLRSLDERFLGKVRVLYGEISRHLQGLLWKDGGPVIGIQVDNEYGGPAEYLLALKQIALDAGLDLPIYTRTGWPRLTSPMPFGEILPLYGAYAEGFWSRELTSMPGQFWTAFRFSLLRVDDVIAQEQFGRGGAHDAPDVARYPYLTCEVGGGMMSSYHRRILILPEDVESTVFVKLGSGSTLPGYYMYHGGTNPAGKLTTLMEAQDTPMTNYNDMPQMNYDFQAPIGEFGQLRPQYHLLRRLHLFLADFGPALAHMRPAIPNVRPGGRDDTSTLCWSVRSDGTRGYVFVNNYERSLPMPEKRGVQFTVNLPSAPVTFPAIPITVPADSIFVWPFNFFLGDWVRLKYATAQPICGVDDGDERTIFFAETPGVPAQFAVEGESAVRSVSAGRGGAFQVKGRTGRTVRVVLLSDADSLALWKGSWRGCDRVFLTRAGMVIDGDSVHLESSDRTELSVGIYPAPAGLAGGESDGIFTRYQPVAPPAVRPEASIAQIQEAGPARDVPIGKISEPVATEPSDADFAKAAVWRVKLPAEIDLGTNPILRIHYVGDVARFTLDGRLLVDDFYNGNSLDLGLRRYAPGILGGDLRIAVLPLRKDAVTGDEKRIFVADSVRPDFGGASSIAELKGAEIIPRYRVQLPPAGPQ
ncbi:MAG TPA: beta-galactosidase [Opitutaceae bacterium]|nr:beta-galactosidase [Opitutaceae bacterium]